MRRKEESPGDFAKLPPAGLGLCIERGGSSDEGGSRGTMNGSRGGLGNYAALP